MPTVLCIIYPAGNLPDTFQTPKHYFLRLSSLISFSSFSALVQQIKQYQQTLLKNTLYPITNPDTLISKWKMKHRWILTYIATRIYSVVHLFIHVLVESAAHFSAQKWINTQRKLQDSSLLINQTNFRVKHFHNIVFVCKITWINSQVSLKTYFSSHLSVLTRLIPQFMQKVAQKTLSLRIGGEYQYIYLIL